MAAKKQSDDEFLELWAKYKSITEIAKVTGMDMRSVGRRRRAVEEKLKITLSPQITFGAAQSENSNKPQRLNLGIENGTVLVFSDAHFWPTIRTTALKGLLWAINEFKPKAVICNGDAFDGASISRHPRIGWDQTPSVIQELKACQAALGEIEEAAKKARHNAKLIWPLGNHDARFETRLANTAPEFASVSGFTLKDHFPNWEPCWSVWITDEVIVKHRYKGGVHATHNNTVNSGKSIVTGHLHSLKVTPFNDYGGNRFGVDTGTLADPDGPQFAYAEQNPQNHRSGFAVLNFTDGKLLWPELVHRWGEGTIEFRGQLYDVGGL
ncbi:MAG: metallophosphoesterase [Burkholderiaceae bacterium]